MRSAAYVFCHLSRATEHMEMKGHPDGVALFLVGC
jgi:hypothetical protein